MYALAIRLSPHPTILPPKAPGADAKNTTARRPRRAFRSIFLLPSKEASTLLKPNGQRCCSKMKRPAPPVRVKSLSTTALIVRLSRLAVKENRRKFVMGQLWVAGPVARPSWPCIARASSPCLVQKPPETDPLRKFWR